MRTFLKVLISILSVLYPVLVFVLLVVYRFPVRIISLCVIVMALVFFLSASGRSKSNEKLNLKPIISGAVFLTLGIVCFVTNSKIFLKFYPVVICTSMLFVFGLSLFNPPCIVFRFATLQDKTIIGSINERRVYNYCKKVTYVWCGFFILNSLVALYTAFFCDDRVWSLYNGGISYIIMGTIFAVEFLIRRVVNSHMPQLHTITKFTADSRKDDYIMCYEDKWSSGIYKTWKDFLHDSCVMRKYIEKNSSEKWILHCNDYWFFLVTFVALLQCKKQVMLTANISPAFLEEMRQPGMVFLSDVKDAPNSIYIPEIFQNPPAVTDQEMRSIPKVNADDTQIHMFTSGSTGKPKDVLQRMTEFEIDNEFVFSKWGDEFLKRKLVATVSQHHIYGFLFTIALPFAAGIPFRRTRIEFPTEFEKLDDEKYMIIAVPAFLKRTVEAMDNLPLKEPFIFTSGGVLLPEVAKKTDQVFGFWPVEVYGSTETSGIAWRQSKNGLEWTPFDNAKIWQNEDGCLIIRSPYIKNPEGFQTADLVEILSDGRFLMKGRIDSIVKIEEKRISMTEVENRILQTGLVKDVCVVAMNDRRQYLAAAIVFNEEGKKKFEGMRKLDINNFFHNFLIQYFENVVLPKKWRFLDALPMDLQGKKKKLEIQALFTKTEDDNKMN